MKSKCRPSFRKHNVGVTDRSGRHAEPKEAHALRRFKALMKKNARKLPFAAYSE